MSQFQLTLRDAIAKQEELAIDQWYNEYEVINPYDEPKKQRTLFTELRPRPRLVANPDAAFLLSYREHRVVYYVERERGGTGANQLRDRKTPGYEGLLRQQGHCSLHFPTSTYAKGFTVLCPVQSIGHRKAVCRAFAGTTAAKLWRFASVTELASETILTEPIWYSADREEPTPLVTLS